MTEDTPDTHGPAAPDPHIAALDDLERFLAEQRRHSHRRAEMMKRQGMTSSAYIAIRNTGRIDQWLGAVAAARKEHLSQKDTPK